MFLPFANFSGVSCETLFTVCQAPFKKKSREKFCMRRGGVIDCKLMALNIILSMLLGVVGLLGMLVSVILWWVGIYRGGDDGE